MKETESAGGVVLNSRGEVVVVSQRGDSWSLPKGHLDPGENARETAVREIEEECGITKLEYVRDLGSYERYRIAKGGVGDDTSELKRLHLFLFKAEAESLVPIDPENPEARWVPLAKVVDLLTHPKDKEFFRSIQSSLS